MKKNNNNGIFYVVISLVAVLGIAGLVRAYSNIQTQNINVEGNYINNEAEGQVEEVSFGAQASPDNYQRQYFHAGYNTGGDTFASSTLTSAETVLAADIDNDIFYISYTPNLATTLTLPATTTMSNVLGSRAGDTREYIVYNASTTAAATLTLAAGTGIDLQKNEDTADLAINGLDSAKLTFIRKVDSDIMVMMEEYIVAD